MKNETLERMEGRILNLIDKAEEFGIESKEGQMAAKEALEWTEKLTALEHDGFDYFDKEDRRKIEREKIEANQKIEEMKQVITWKRVVFELSKALLPVVATMIGYDRFQKRLMKYEENGRIASTAGRELHLPKFLK